MPSILERYESTFAKDRELSQQAQDIFPDGVTHDNRHADPFPVYISHADGSKKYSISGQEFIDYWCGHGALLLSHNPPEVVEAVSAQIGRNPSRRIASARNGMGTMGQRPDPFSRACPLRELRHGSYADGYPSRTNLYKPE